MRQAKSMFLVALIFSCALLDPGLADDVKFASDITRLGVGARPLGMGKAFVGLSDDISAMFLNPAGLSGLETRQLLSMSGRFVNEVSYLTLAGAIKTRFGPIAVGYAGAGLDFSSPVLNLVEIATGEYRVVPSTGEAVNYNYNDYALLFSYADTILVPELSWGGSLKLFSESISGTTTVNGQGLDIDLGLLYKPFHFISFGVSGKNLLPYALGGRMSWNSGLTEAIPSTLILGTNIELDARGKLNLCLDYEMQPTQPNIPNFFHAGAEYWLLPMFAVRGGFDQDVIGTGSGTALEVTTNPTAGISLLVYDYRFDYAYHRYNDLASNDTHYFSLAYLQSKPLPLRLAAPPDKLITYESSAPVRGKVDNWEIDHITVNSQPVKLKDHRFETTAELEIGKNSILAIGRNRLGKTIEATGVRVLRLQQFPDVEPDNQARGAIEKLATLGILTGYPDGTFKPERRLNRAEYTTVLARVKELVKPEVLELPFGDVPASHWAAGSIMAAYLEKIVKGYPDNTFKPKKEISRVEGVAAVARFAELDIDQPVDVKPYPDIAARHWAIKEISAAKAAGLLEHIGEGRFDPQEPMTRAEFALIISRTPLVARKIYDLMDWEIGYDPITIKKL